MVYLMLEILVWVFAVLVVATLAFFLCATVLLAQEMLKHVSRSLHAAAGYIAQCVAEFRHSASEGDLNELSGEPLPPSLSAARRGA